MINLVAQNGPLGLIEKIILLGLGLGFPRTVHFTLLITHEIYHSMDEGYEIQGVFLDISKAFDKVLHECLVFKLKQNGISGNLLNIFEDFRRNAKQRVLLMGRHLIGKIFMQVFPKALSWDHCCS